MNFKEQFSYYVNLFEENLNTHLEKNCSDNSVIAKAIKYAVMDGGKRIRPVLCFASADMLGVDISKVLCYALAIEYIHSYSLVHDDLPCMDNDDYRRGKLSTHKKFGENIGVLCGDALLNLAYKTLFANSCFSKLDYISCNLVADYAGHKGMIYGQELDLINEKSYCVKEALLDDIILNKTSKLITLPLLVSSILSGKKHFDKLKIYGENLGKLFQITDDLIDIEGSFEKIGKTPHKDESADKLTSVKVFGYDGAKAKAKECYLRCLEVLSSIDNSEFLVKLTEEIYLRKA